MTGIEIAAVAAAVGIAKNLKDLTSSLGQSVPPEVRDEILALFDKVMDIQTEVLTAQDRDIKLTDRCRELEDQLKRVEAWEAEKARYRLREIVKQVYVYELKPERVEEEEPEHSLCAKCFQEGRKSHLQKTGYDDELLSCWHCEKSLDVSTGSGASGASVF